MKMPERIRSLIEGLVPWYDPQTEARRDMHSQHVQRQSLTARGTAERVMNDRLGSYQRTRLHR